MLLSTNARKFYEPVFPVGDVDDEQDVYGTFQSSSAPTVSNHADNSHGPMRRAVVVATAFLLFATAAYVTTTFTTSSIHIELVKKETTTKMAVFDVEQRFLSNINRTNMREYLHKYASTPHPCGSEEDYKTALYTAEMLESFGIHAEINEYYTLLSTPVRQRLAIVKPASSARELNLTEGTVSGDSCTTAEDALPPFLAYAASGNVTASVVYTNFGTPTDYRWLIDQNVTLKGKIALVRYGGNDRGTKVMIAEQHGMTGVLIYSDPNDDGFGKGAVYPDGPWRPEDSFQRGAIDYLSVAAGDPLTPGYPSNPGAAYLDIDDVTCIPHIPAIPLSYGQAKYILRALGGKKAPENWQGGVSVDRGYHIGDDETTVVNMDIEIDNSIGPIWNVIGTIEGAIEPEQQVIIGNHRDAWVCGAIDPNSGSSVLLEVARGFGELLQHGWKPRRTIKLGSWDGEEYALLGSTEYAEDHAAILTEQAVAYINVDAFLGPLVSAGGAPAIAKFLQDTAKAIPVNQFYGNETETTLYEQWTAQQVDRVARNVDITQGTLAPDYMITLLGSGTDYTPFYQFLGIVSANIAFGLTDEAYGVYHSTMDSIMYSEKFADPNYSTHETMAQWWGLITLRLADAKILPFDYSTYSVAMEQKLVKFETQLAALHIIVDFSKLHAAIKKFGEKATAFHAALSLFIKSGNLTDETVRPWNDRLMHLERYFLSEDGLPHRPWYKHMIFGPGFYEGYLAAAFPGIADSILFQDDGATIQHHVDVIARTIESASTFITI